MKLNISEVIKDYDGVVLFDGKVPLDMRKLLRMYAGSYIPEPGPNAATNSVIADAVAQKIHAANGEIELTDEEFEVLKLVIETPMHTAMVYSKIRAFVYPPEKGE